MDFALSPELITLRAEALQVGRAAASRSSLTEDTWIAAPDRAFSLELAARGWLGMTWPAEVGGGGRSPLERFVVYEALLSTGAPMATSWFADRQMGPTLLQFGTEAQQRRYLPQILDGTSAWSIGMSEPDAGSDVASIRTRAVRDGDHFVVNGQKIWTSLGHLADWCALFVRTDPDAPKHKGISCLIVDMGLPGIEARPLTTLAGDAEFAEVFFDDVRVPASALLGPLHGGWGVATNTLSHERAGAAQLYARIRERLRDLVADLRAAPGAPLEDPRTLERLGGLEVRLQYLEVLCQRAISAAAHGGDPTGQASLAKTVWGELDQDIAALGDELLGGDDPGGRWAIGRLTSRSLTIAGGTTQVNKNITAQRVLGLPRR